MRGREKFLTLAAVIVLGFFAWVGGSSAEDAPPPVAPAQAIEEDRSAAASFEAAIKKLDPMVRAKKGRPEEGMLTLRLVETYAKLTGVRFRLAHAPGASEADRAQLESALDSTQRWSSLYLQKFPRGEGVARAVYLRAKARGDAKSEDASIADYRYLIDHFEPGPDHVSAHLTLHELLVKKQDFRTAVAYLKKLGATPRDGHYSLVLDHFAFAHYSLNEIPASIRYLEAELALFPEAAELTATALSERDKIFGNLALYYFTGVEKKMPGFSWQSYLAQVLKLKPGLALNKALMLYANLMRTKGWDAELQGFQAQVIAAKVPLPAQLEVILTTFESQLGKRRWREIRDSAAVLGRVAPLALEAEADPIRREKLEAHTSKLMAQAIDTLQKSFSISKGRPEYREISVALLFCYDLLLKTTPEPKAQVKVRFNIAETYSAMGDLKTAALKYRAVLELAGQVSAVERPLIEKAAFLALSARYEALAQVGAFPKELKPVAMAAAVEKKLEASLEEWLSWVDEAPKYGVAKEPTYATLRFETNRVFYAAGRVKVAIERLHQWVITEPTSKYAMSAASLILDTNLLGKQWLEAFTRATEYDRAFPPQEAVFHARLKEVAADSYFQLAEEVYAKKDYPDVLKRVEQLVRAYPKSKRIPDGWSIGANAALALGDRKRALEFFSLLLKARPSTSVQAQAALTAASLAEDSYRLRDAVVELRKALQVPSQTLAAAGLDPSEARRKVLLYSWLSGDDSLLSGVLADRIICAGPIVAECDKYSTYLVGKFGGVWRGRPTAFSQWVNSIQALSQGEKLPLHELRAELERTAFLWGKIDPLLQLSLLSRMTTLVPKNILRLAVLVDRAAPVSLDKKTIERRSRLIESVSSTLEKLTQLPFAGVQVAALQTWADLYADFTRSVLRIDGMMAELVKPFREKAHEIRAKAIERVQGEAVDEAIASAVWREWLKEEPAALMQLGGRLPTFTAASPFPLLVFVWLGGKDATPEWRAAMADAARRRALPAISFLAQQAGEKKFASLEALQAMKGFSLLLAGAQAEGIAELGWVSQKLAGPAKAVAMAQLVEAYLGARSREKAKTWLDLLAKETSAAERKQVLAPSQLQLLSAGHAWVNTRLPASAPSAPKEHQ